MKVRNSQWVTYPAELRTTVTALGCGRKLFDVMIAENATGGLDDAPP
jgi:hypothetical protein